MSIDEIAEVISVGLDPNGETAQVILNALLAADELARAVEYGCGGKKLMEYVKNYNQAKGDV